MSASQAVPHVALVGRVLPGAYARTWRCTDCEMPFAAAGEAALAAAFDAHVAYVNAAADKASDPHFALLRLDTLIGDA